MGCTCRHIVCMVCGMPDTLSGLVAANLRGELARQNITHEEFADMITVRGSTISRQAVTNRCLGRTPLTLDELALYADLLKIEPAKLLND